MADADVKYKNKTVTTIRGLEARSIAKWEKEGWEFVSQAPAKLLRTTLAFRRPKKQVPRWVWAAAAAAVVLLGIGVTVAAVQASHVGASQGASSPSPTVSETSSVEPSPAATAQPVTDAEVLAAFNSFFEERAASGVLWGKAVSNVTFENRVVHVTFDPAAAGVDQATFDGLAADFHFPSFVATPVAFNDEVGNRLRPSIDSIEAVRVDGTSLGTIDAGGILALNGLSQ